jgi:hypothetical protein
VSPFSCAIAAYPSYPFGYPFAPEYPFSFAGIGKDCNALGTLLEC